ncbi:hypothetical protein Mal33_18770 [Rosistilla oblonga]|uniref:Uncharacterized protein n=1 Tax=Rosistilla oblonga TaxID=2527990 RepID=A0A518IS22_9BACT|nr:hypothetical protein Mal33_18770 [Rosistilla oblonga]
MHQGGKDQPSLIRSFLLEGFRIFKAGAGGTCRCVNRSGQLKN